MIFYFSGTGNSQRVAKQISEVTNDSIFSINASLKRKSQESLSSEKPLVFVAPVYAWRLPRVVEQWILEHTFEGSKSAYFVLTCGDSSGNASHYAEKLCKEKGFHFCGLLDVLMPENYIAMYPAPPQEKVQELLAKSVPLVNDIANHIKDGHPLSKKAPSVLGKLASNTINPLFYSLFVKDKGFTVTDSCIACGKCDKLCPLNNIRMQDGKPVWNGNCTHCMACICACPTVAIEYKRNSKGQARYYIMEEEQDDLVLSGRNSDLDA